MTRGNQREKAREKNQKKNQKPKKKEDGGNTFKKRAESDAEIMRQKQQKAVEKTATTTEEK